MTTSHKQNDYKKDDTIRKQSKNIEKLQSEVNALKIRLLGAPNSTCHSRADSEPASFNTQQPSISWQASSYLVKTG